MSETTLGGAEGGQTAVADPATSTSTTSTTTTGEKSWRDTLPEDIKNDPSLLPFSDIGNLAKSYISTKQMVGKKGAIVPDWAKSTPEEQQAFFKSIGVPDADKYDVAPPKDVKVNPEIVKQFKDAALKNGLLPKQANEILGWYTKLESDAVGKAGDARETQRKEQMEGLKKEWGDGFQKNIASARLAVKEIGGDDFIKYLDESGIGNDINVIKFAAKAAKLLGEDRLREGGVTSEGISPHDIKAQMSEIMARGDENGYFDAKHPMHKITLAKMESLGKMLTGGR